MYVCLRIYAVNSSNQFQFKSNFPGPQWPFCYSNDVTKPEAHTNRFFCSSTLLLGMHGCMYYYYYAACHHQTHLFFFQFSLSHQWFHQLTVSFPCDQRNSVLHAHVVTEISLALPQRHINKQMNNLNSRPTTPKPLKIHLSLAFSLSF